MKTKLNLVGYFDHFNLGDEQYKVSFSYILKNLLKLKDNTEFVFNSYDNLEKCKVEENEVIILSGGDVLNDYFLDLLIKKFKNRKNKIVAISVGVPYTDTIRYTNKIDIIDYFFLRSRRDINFLKELGKKVEYLPDTSIVLKKSLVNFDSESLSFKLLDFFKSLKKDRKIICVNLTSHIIDESDRQAYQEIIESFISFIKFATTFNYYIVFLPFNTNDKNKTENDKIIHRDIHEQVCKEPRISKYVYKIEDTLDYFQVIKLYNLADYVITMRFHGVLFSMYAKTPVLPIFCSRKIKNLLLDTGWKYGYELVKKSNDKPKFLETCVLIEKFRVLSSISPETHFKNLEEINKNFDKDFFNSCYKLEKMLYFEKDFQKEKFVEKNYLEKQVMDAFIKTKRVIKEIGYTCLRNISKEEDRDFIVKYISYLLTGVFNSPFNYGLREKIFRKEGDYNFYDEWGYIVKENRRFLKSNCPSNNKEGSFCIVNNLEYFRKRHDNIHRAGWNYVYNNIYFDNNDSSDLILDLYLDKTFHWDKRISKTLGLIPYKKPWVGFIHHTFDESFSSYNNFNLLRDSDFIESLKHCKGIIVLSSYIKNLFLLHLSRMDINVRVYNLNHPTSFDFGNNYFTLEKFLKNPSPKLLHVGGWLRNVFSFHLLDIPSKLEYTNCLGVKNSISIEKAALKGEFMNNYFPEQDFSDKFKKVFSPKNSNNQGVKFCSQNQNELTNNWYKHLNSFIKQKIESVKVLDRISNEDYDKLLSENIIFLNLVDCSAVNTILECISRNTPVIINKHPAVQELLGENYPMYIEYTESFFMFNKQVLEKLEIRVIKSTVKYLKKLDKTNLKIEDFKEKFQEIIEEVKN